MARATCNCRDEVNAKVDNGELSQSLSRNSHITEQGRESLTHQACDRKSLRSRFVDNGEVRSALRNWNSNHIDFLFYRSQHEHDNDLNQG